MNTTAIKFQLFTTALMLLLFACTADGNTSIQSFHSAKKNLEKSIYFDNRETVYCSASFDSEKNIVAAEGFETTKYVNRAKRLEWEHIVPAENFGRTFSEWRDGHKKCVNSKGKKFKGRKCAYKMNSEYRYMSADMYNLFPAIGSVNGMRSNYQFVERVDKGYSFGSCEMVISAGKVQPTDQSKGRIARSYLYMQDTYSRYKIGKPQVSLMQAWDKQYPVSDWECLRYKRIKAVQRSENYIMKTRCSD